MAHALVVEKIAQRDFIHGGDQFYHHHRHGQHSHTAEKILFLRKVPHQLRRPPDLSRTAQRSAGAGLSGK